jgi:GNAT superfamily N-acetyltransferase
MKSLLIQSVETEKDRIEFLSLPWKVYKDNPYWVPPIFSERIHFIKHHPFLDHADIEFFMAKRGDEVVGTIAAFINHRHNEFQNENIGFFGFFEVLDDPEAATELLETAEKWVKTRGYDAIRGPAQYSTNEECGLLVDGFDDNPRILMTYNPPRYITYIENQGFSKVMDLHAYSQDIANFTGEGELPAKLTRVVNKIKDRQGIKIRKVDLKNYDLEVERVKKIYNLSWAKNWGFIPMTDEEFIGMGKELRQILDPDLTLVGEVNGEPIGVSITLPDLNQPLRKAYPTPHTPDWLTMAKLIWNWKVRRQVTWLRVLILGVLPEYRIRGVDALFYYETAQAAIKKGIKHAEMSWILENNYAISRPIEVMGGKVYKTYRFYEKWSD